MPPDRSGKVRVVRTSSKRDAPSATSAPSGLAPEDWVLSALVIARRAAMADDLEHVPSIKGIADIFTRMLKQLQGKKKNMDEFRVITNEIGSLIESVVQYAREHNPVSERYKRVCNDFLSTMSDMQTEMEQMFLKRSTKAKAYQTILSSYQFNVRSLRIDVQALTPPSPLTSSTGILSNSRDITIVGSTIQDIQGDLNQYVFHGHVTADFHSGSAEQESAERIDELDCSDYRTLKYGDLRAISVPRKRNRSILLDDGHEQDVPHEYTASYQNQIVTARTYRGQSALQSFKDDIKVILEHNFRHPHILQLFGICSSRKVPTLVYHGDLKILNQAHVLRWNLASRDNLCRLFQIYEESLAAFRFLMREYQLHDSASGFLIRDGQFIHNRSSEELYVLPISVPFSNCTCHLYVDNSQHLQVSIEAPLTQVLGFGFYRFPKLSVHDVEAIKIALLSRRTIPDIHHIDKKACLLAIYDDIVYKNSLPLVVHESPLILISPMKYVKAARLTFDRECRFTWSGWRLSCRTGLGVELPNPSYITLGNISWTCYKIPHNVSTERIPDICSSSSFDAPSLYCKMWMAQSEILMSQIKSKCTSFSEHMMALVTSVECNIFFQSCFSTSSSFQAPKAVYLFVQDLQEVDDVFEIPWFWAKDSKGLQRLSAADMLVLGLGKPRQSRIPLVSRNAALGDPRILHEIFGFAPDSPDIPRFLDLPVASVEWDGDDNGPLTPWELLVNHDYYEGKRFLDA